MSKSGDGHDDGPSRTKMRTSREVYDRIRWDARFDPSDFTIGYESRNEGMKEIPYAAYVPGGDIPWHRLWYFRQGDAVVWDRRTRVDTIFGSGADVAHEEGMPSLASPPSSRRPAPAPSELLPLSRVAPVHRSAVALVPPAEAWPAIQAIRTRYDKHVARWMPHINLLYGFLPEERFAEAAAIISDALREVAPFTLTFAEFDRFDHRSSTTAWLRPTTDPPHALEDLQAKLEALFPRCSEQSTVSERGFTPHLSVAQLQRGEVIAKMAEWSRAWRPLSFPVEAIQLISRRGDEPFVVRHAVALGTGTVRSSSD